MELAALKAFVTVAEELHFGRAAKRLNLTQPPLSRQIMKLEEELGVTLFRRSSRVVELTEAGRILREEAAAVLSRARLLRERMARAADGGGGALAIGFNEPALHTVLPGAVRRFRRRCPETELRLFEMETRQQLDALRDRTIDLALVRPAEDDLAGLASRPLYREEYLLALPAGDPLAAQEPVPLPALAGRPLILFARRANPAVHAALLAALHRAGVTPEPGPEAGNKATILALVRAGLGAGIVPESSRLTAPPEVIFRRLGPGLPPIRIMAAWLDGEPPPPLRNFLDILDAGRRPGA